MSTARPQMDFMPPPAVNKWQRVALIVGVLGAIGGAIGWAIEADNFYRAYLIGYMWMMEITLGSLALLMLYHLTGGAWGTVIRRILEAAMSNIWVMIVLFIPIVIGAHHLYVWSRPEAIIADPDLRRVSHSYLSMRFWIFRAVLYFTIFGLLVTILNKISRRQDRPPEVNFDVRLRGISGAGEMVYIFATFFLYVDWMMSITPHYVSMVYPLIFNAGQGLSTVCFAVIIAALLKPHQPMKDIMKPDQFLDLGKIMLAFTMIWGWWTYGQWIIFWSGNLPEEIAWFIDRTRGGWEHWGFAIILAHFVVPFVLLLSRPLKSNYRTLCWIAVWELVARYMDILYYIEPSFPNRRGHFHYTWLDGVVPLGIAGIWATFFFWQLKKRPLLALHDAHARIMIEEGHEHELERS